ncbi:AMP-binding protein [Nocardioides immobilis]
MGYDDRDTIYTCLPMFHINGLFCALYAGLIVGAHVVVAPRFGLSSFWDDIIDHEVTAGTHIGAVTTRCCGCRGRMSPRPRSKPCFCAT